MEFDIEERHKNFTFFWVPSPNKINDTILYRERISIEEVLNFLSVICPQAYVAAWDFSLSLFPHFLWLRS